MIIVPPFNINISVRCTSEIHNKHFSTNIMVRCTSVFRTKNISTILMVLRASVFRTKNNSTILVVLRTLLVYSIQLNSKLFGRIFGLFKAAELQNICSRDA